MWHACLACRQTGACAHRPAGVHRRLAVIETTPGDKKMIKRRGADMTCNCSVIVDSKEMVDERLRGMSAEKRLMGQCVSGTIRFILLGRRHKNLSGGASDGN